MDANSSAANGRHVATATKRRRLGDVLVEKRLISPDQLRIALVEQKSAGAPLGRVLIMLGFITEPSLRDALAEALAQQCIDLSAQMPAADAIGMLPAEVATRLNVLPVAYHSAQRQLVLAMADTFDVVAIDQIAALIGNGIRVVPVLAGEGEISEGIARHYGSAGSTERILREIESNHTPAYNENDGAVRLVDALIDEAVRCGASDLHFEPEHGCLRIRCRVDGVLSTARTLHRHFRSPVAVRLKVLANLDIAENRAPQDGRFALTVQGRAVDFRVSVFPTLHGENIVLRVLDTKKGIVPLPYLGLTDESLGALRKMQAHPAGMILVTGPTGSGKTTTLYSLLSALDAAGANIMTLEDPVEYPMPAFRQTTVNEAARIGFADGIRALLRQDPDVILLGEIRDGETAQMAMRAAMTGHQIYSTLHANSAPAAFSRLYDLGLTPELVAGNVIGIVAQRLVRRLCRHCREPHVPAAAEYALVGEQAQKLVLWRARGCGHCGQQGYRGRVVIMEVLTMDDVLDELILRRASPRELRCAAIARGFRTLADDGLRRVLDGDTSLAEVARMVDFAAER